MSSSLEIHEPPAEPAFFCPGESSPVSLAVHRARQAADWPGCRDCPARDTPAADPSFDLRTHVRRTEYGVRGVWQNALSRQVAGQLIGVLTGYLLHQQTAARPHSAVDSTDLPAATADDTVPLTLVMGCDGRPSSPDIYAGAVSAALQNGCNVIDAGRTTVAQLQELCRTVPSAVCGIIITGSGEPQAFTGFDAFDRQGEAIPVPWQSWGIELRRQSESFNAPQQPHQPDGREAMARLRHAMSRDELSRYPETVGHSGVDRSTTLLIVPNDSPGSAARFRVSRRSGVCRAVEAEDRYRQWLRRWFPPGLQSQPACLCADPLTAERFMELSEDAGISADVLPIASTRSVTEQLSQRIRDTHAEWGFCISEDDRCLTVANQYGQCLSAELLSRWINETIHNSRAHITTHVPGGSERVVILDAARPHQAASHEVIADALALVGCIGQILTRGIRLPRTD